MDFIQDYIHLLPKFLPPSLFKTLISFTTTTFGVFKALQAHMSPLLSRVVSHPDMTSVFLLLVIAYISFKVLDMAYRAVMFWVFFAYRVVLYGGLIGIGLWIYNRGPEGFAEDLSNLAEYWTGQYHKFSEEVEHFQRQKEQDIYRKQNPSYMRWQ